MTKQGNDLVAKIIERNVDDLVASYKHQIEYYKSQAKVIAQALIKLDSMIDACDVVDRRLLDAQVTETVLRGVSAAEYALAEQDLEKGDGE